MIALTCLGPSLGVASDTSAKQLRTKQDEWCKIGAANKEPYPEDLEWESLVDVLRGKVNVNVHCYEAVDFDQLIRLTNEFEFSIAAVHHAHEAYLVPDLLKKAYGHVPVAAIFATFKVSSVPGSVRPEPAPAKLTDMHLLISICRTTSAKPCVLE